MSGKLIAVANMKGGVGKTTTVVSLSEAFAAENTNVSVLVVDLDPQASASICLAGDDLLAEMITTGRTLEVFLDLRLIKRGRATLDRRIHRHPSQTTHAGNQLNISLLPCGPNLRRIEQEILYKSKKSYFGLKGLESELWKLFQLEILPLSRSFDYIIFDCAPGISPLTEVAIRASDLVVVPTIPDRISVFGLNAFCGSFWAEAITALPRPKLLPHVLITRWQRTVRQHKNIIEQLENEANAENAEIYLLKTRIQQAAALAEALTNTGIPTFKHKYGEMIPVLDELVAELKGVLNGH